MTGQIVVDPETEAKVKAKAIIDNKGRTTSLDHKDRDFNRPTIGGHL